MALPTEFVPLFGPVPGGVEIIVILLIALILFGLPLVLLGGGLYLYRRSQSTRPTDDEIAALREEVQRLREDVQRMDEDADVQRMDEDADVQRMNEDVDDET